MHGAGPTGQAGRPGRLRLRRPRRLLRRQLELEHRLHATPASRWTSTAATRARSPRTRLRRRHPAVLLPAADKPVDFNTTELYGALTCDLRHRSSTRTPSRTTTSASASPASRQRLTPQGPNTGYLDLNANCPLIDKLTLNGHVGYTRFASDLQATIDDGERHSTSASDYTDYKLGVTYDCRRSSAWHLGRDRLRRRQQEGLLRRHQQGAASS